VQLEILYEDNHIIAVNKQVSDIVHSDKTGDKSLEEYVKEYIKDKYNKPGNVFLGVVHRLDRPVSGVLLFARTSKALARLNEMFKTKNNIDKIYWAIVENKPNLPFATLINDLRRDTKKNKTFVCKSPTSDSKQAILNYKLINSSERYYLLEIDLITGRHHQIRAQLSHIGCTIKGDLKYGAKRSNPDGGINLHARYLKIAHPVSKEIIEITAPVPNDNLWNYFTKSQK